MTLCAVIGGRNIAKPHEIKDIQVDPVGSQRKTRDLR